MFLRNKCFIKYLLRHFFFFLHSWGKGEDLLNSVTYGGHRRLLPMKHMLRYLGQSKSCCPRYYYGNSRKEVITDSFLKGGNDGNIISYTMDFKLNKDKKLQRQNNWLCCQNIYEEIADFLNDRTQKVTDFQSEPYRLHLFRKYLFYHHCDYREYVPYSRVSNEQYIEDGRVAAYLNAGKESTADFHFGALSVKSKNEKESNGVKKCWPYAKLPYARIEDNVPYDPFHSIKNCVVHLMNRLMGKKTISTVSMVFCKNTLSHPYLFNQKENISQHQKKRRSKIPKRSKEYGNYQHQCFISLTVIYKM